MEKKLITVVVLPYSKAHIFEIQLKSKKIECELEDVHVIQGAISTSVKVKVLEKDIQEVVLELEEFMGSKISVPAPQDQENMILVPVDFSKTSKKAALLAIDIASHLNADLVFMHSFMNPIFHTMPYGDVFAYDSSALFKMKYADKEANDNFLQFMNELAKETGEEKWNAVKTDYIIKSGSAEDDILAYSRKHSPRLIVVGSVGNNSPQGIVGSVTADIMYNANVPVLVIPKDTTSCKVADFANVLYATNFDEKDFAALDKLMTILKPFEINLTCVHVGEPRRNGWDLARLEGMKDIFKEKYVNKNFNCILLKGNDVLQSLEDYIGKEKVDLLSLTTHKRNMISRLFNPSLARKMVFHGHTPLLIFHA
jgi:nucleotide-binding universal stress UspA family protein